jgi:hypothetical protein
LALASGVTLPRVEICPCPLEEATAATNSIITGAMPRSTFFVFRELLFFSIVRLSEKAVT